MVIVVIVVVIIVIIISECIIFSERTLPKNMKRWPVSTSESITFGVGIKD